MHKLNTPAESVADLNRYNLRVEGVYDASVYQDIEVNDFNRLFVKESIIGSQFG